MTVIKENQLLVEGQEDKFSIVGLMEHHVEWSNDPREAPVHIEAVGGVTEILKASYLRTKLKESGLRVLGIMIDADAEPVERWDSFRLICQDIFPDIPRTMPTNGLVIENPSGLRLGLWIMPDCSSEGMLETFLRYLVPGDNLPLWDHAESAFDVARRIGSPCRPVHFDKARMHTWLAWQNPPGESLGRALTRKTLDPTAPTANAFVAWFKHLYSL